MSSSFIDGNRGRAIVGAAVGFIFGAMAVLLSVPLTDGSKGPPFMALATIVGAIGGRLLSNILLARAAIVVALLLAMVCLTPAVDLLVRSWTRVDATPALPLDAVVVLSTGVSRSGRIDQTAVERLLTGMETARAMHAKMLITTQVRNVDSHVTSDADQRQLVQLGFEVSSWRVVGPVRSTRDEATETAALLSPAGKRIAVVTSPMHSRRACATFERVGFHVTCRPSPGRRYSPFDLRYATERFHALMDYVYERSGMIEYRLRGWVSS
jgi:uncharacterized SAM-binding protein YcdF (DUF218 family)